MQDCSHNIYVYIYIMFCSYSFRWLSDGLGERSSPEDCSDRFKEFESLSEDVLLMYADNVYICVCVYVYMYI